MILNDEQEAVLFAQYQFLLWQQLGIPVTKEQFIKTVENLRQYVAIDDSEVNKQLNLGGIYGAWGGCTHTKLSEAEFIAVCVDLYGGSWQRFYEKVTAKGLGLYR